MIDPSRDVGDGLRVSGGHRGVAAALDQLWAAAGRLDAVAADLSLDAVALGGVMTDPVLGLFWALAPGPSAVIAVRAAAVAGGGGPGGAAVDVAATSAALRAAVLGYLAADAAANAAVCAGGRTPLGAGLAGRVWLGLGGAGALAGFGGPLAPAGRHFLAGPLAARTVSAAVASLPEIASGPLMLPPGALTPTDVARAGLAVPRVAGLLQESPVMVGEGRPAVPAGARWGARSGASSGVADLLRSTGTATDKDRGPGIVRVVEVVAADGSSAWVVEVPGTQEWSADPEPGDSPFDLASAMALRAHQPAGGAVAVVTAMSRAGVPPGDPVLLVGHSQGGMVAAAVAADPAVRTRFRVTHVITAGSPIADARIPASTQVLSIEHDDDLVPALDGATNPDRPSWLTVTRRSPFGHGSLPPHDSAGYVDTAGLVDASTDPDIVEFRAGLAPFLDGPGVSVRSTDFRSVRSGSDGPP